MLVNKQVFYEIVKTTSMEIVHLSQSDFCFELLSVLLKKELKGLEISIMNIITLVTIHRFSYIRLTYS